MTLAERPVTMEDLISFTPSRLSTPVELESAPSKEPSSIRPHPSISARCKEDNTYLASIVESESVLLVRRGTCWLQDSERDKKVVPAVQYAKNMSEDFGLCADAFEEGEECAAGKQCRWRHHPLTEGEISRMVSSYPKRINELVSTYTTQTCMQTQWVL
jgi:hypothetical protein